MNKKWYQINNVYNKYEQIIKKNIFKKLNKQQYIKTGSLARCRAVNSGRPVGCRNSLWEQRKRGTTAAASQVAMRRTPGEFLSRANETPYFLKRNYRDNVNIGAAWVYTFIVVVISSIYFLISSIFISLWNSHVEATALLTSRRCGCRTQGGADRKKAYHINQF